MHIENEIDKAFERVLDQVGFLMNAIDPGEELHKLMAYQLTIDPEAQNESYVEIMDKIIMNLVDFYKDSYLHEVWLDYLEVLEENSESAA